MYADTYEVRRFRDPAVRRRLAVMERTILACTSGSRRALDVGCGTGRFTVQLRVNHAIGIDKSRPMLDVARRRNVACVLGDAHALPFKSGEFDAVVSTDQVFATLQIESALTEVNRVLAPGGILAIHYPTHDVWTPRRPFGITPIPNRRGRPAGEVVAIARELALELECRKLWRTLRWYPYLVPVPPFLGLKIWSHGILVFRKR